MPSFPRLGFHSTFICFEPFLLVLLSGAFLGCSSVHGCSRLLIIVCNGRNTFAPKLYPSYRCFLLTSVYVYAAGQVVLQCRAVLPSPCEHCAALLSAQRWSTVH